MHKLTLIAGTVYKGSSTLPENKISPEALERALRALRTALADWFGGYTETATNGGWLGKAGALVTEAGVKFEVLTEDRIDKAESMFREIAKNFGRNLEQECVLVSVEPVRFSFINTEE